MTITSGYLQLDVWQNYSHAICNRHNDLIYEIFFFKFLKIRSKLAPSLRTKCPQVQSPGQTRATTCVNVCQQEPTAHSQRCSFRKGDQESAHASLSSVNRHSAHSTNATCICITVKPSHPKERFLSKTYSIFTYNDFLYVIFYIFHI